MADVIVSRVSTLLEEMRAQGSLPAIEDNVQAIASMSRKTNSDAMDLAAVIMRDAGLTSNLLATANSAFYSPRIPIKTVSYAVSFLGFEKVLAMTIGLSIFKQAMKSARDQKLAALYASSYFSATFARALAQAARCASPEEAFVAGLLYRLPWLALANSYPDDFATMENLIREQGKTTDEACRRVFGVEYHVLCKELGSVYRLPESILEIVVGGSADSTIGTLVRGAADVAAMLFGSRMGGKDAMAGVEGKLQEVLGSETFNLSDFIKDTCVNDYNITRFFNLDPGDVEMMVRALEWGKGNPAEIAAGPRTAGAVDREEERDEPEILIGHFITELMLGSRRQTDINEILMLAQEAIYRCFPGSEVFTCFVNNDRSAMAGRFYVGSDRTLKPSAFEVSLNDSGSAIIQALAKNISGSWSSASRARLGASRVADALDLKVAIFCPIQVNRRPIGLYFVGRSQDHPPFDEREQVWLDHLVSFVGARFAQELQ